jgi:pyruvate dehydrogenase E2 component (dihydrolipoamide acetyltransferase)
MATEVTMPRLSDSMEEGTILKWLVEEGAEVKRGEPLVEIETDKANMTYDADADGTLVEVIAKEGDTLAVGEPIAKIGDASESGGGSDESEGDAQAEDDGDSKDEQESGEEEEPKDEEDSKDEEERKDEEEPAADAGEPDDKQEADDEPDEKPSEESDSGSNGDAPDGERVKASPVARRMAEELGVEIGKVEGSGPGGRIVKSDVEAAAKDGESKDGESKDGESKDGSGDGEAEQPDKAPAKGERRESGAKGDTEVIELTRLQKTVSRRMAESKATAPEFTLTVEVDMSLAVELRKRLKDATEHPPSINDMVVKAAATSLREHPRVNGAYRDGKFELYSRVNVGIAVAAQDALVVPTIMDADTKSLGQIARDAHQLAEKVRAGKITPPEVSGGTFTVSNLGMYGIDEFTAVINPPQAAILTVGSLKKRGVVDENGRVVARDTMRLSMVSDHRILYGAEAAEFLARIRELLEQPLALAL